MGELEILQNLAKDNTLLTYLVSGYLLFKMIWASIGGKIIKAWNNYQIRRGKAVNNKYAMRSDCEEMHGMLIKLASSKLDEIKNDVKILHNDIKTMVEQRTFEDGIKRKRDKIVANSVGIFKRNRKIHDFAIHKTERFIQFVFENHKTMWDSDYTFFENRIRALASAVKEEGKAISDPAYVEYFYTNYHIESTNDYLKAVEKIYRDRVNNVSERFVDVSMLFLQTFLSDMVDAYANWKEDSFEEKL